MFSVVTPQKLRADIYAALRAWHQPSGSSADLLDYLLLVQQQRPAAVADGSPASVRLATNRVLLVGIDDLAAQDQRAARVLQARFIDQSTLIEVANKLNVSEHSVSRIQKGAIDRLAEIIEGRESKQREAQAQLEEAKLPPASYTRLFGLKDLRHELEQLLLQTSSPWMIALVGMGGIGKTALADAVVRSLIPRFFFTQIVWLRTQPLTMSGRSSSPQLTYEDLIVKLSQQLCAESADFHSFSERLFCVRQVLKKRPFLIVVDNLESETETAYLLAQLHDLTDPSKFLLTTRTRPSEQATIFNFPLTELTFPDACALMTHHAHDIGVQAVMSATKEEMQSIYDVIGGNPLALKLVVSLLDLLPLSQVLTNLSRSQPGMVENMYRHIYWQTWQLLSQDARQLLQAMPLVAESGGGPRYLEAISGLPEARLWPALQELRSRSLLEVYGTLREKRYGIHRLTETFLQTEIIQLLEDDATI